jgi:hypothetical protein
MQKCKGALPARPEAKYNIQYIFFDILAARRRF